MNSITFSEERNEETCYGYCNEYQPHAVKRMFDHKNGMLYDMRWDEAGNLGQVSMGRPGEMFERGRFLFWTEDSRMHAAVDKKYFSYYVYDHSGERRLKLTGINKQQDVNADLMATYTVLNEPTLYPSAYMVLTNKGYTNVTEVESRASSLALPRCSNVTERKHYYAGTERVAARLGGGGLDALYHVIGNDVELQKKADILFKQSLEQVNSRVLNENNLDCIMSNEFAMEEFGHPIEGIPYQMMADVEFDYGRFNEMVNSMLTDYHNGKEAEVYFYHSDHLGSASWKKERFGKPFASERAEEARSGILHITITYVQHIQYLPYGEPYVDQRHAGATYSERFRFTGKERDEETGYGYFGARYMDHELMTMWLSVDPMADKYPSISPYAYCAWNPVKLVDPDGRDIGDYFDNKGNYLGCDNKKDAKIYILREGQTIETTDDFNKEKTREKFNEVDNGSNLYALISAVYAEMGGADKKSKQIAAESIYNRAHLPDKKYEKADGTYKGVIKKAYDVANPQNKRYDHYANPQNHIYDNDAEHHAWTESASVAIRADMGLCNLGNGVIFYNSASSTIYDNRRGMEKIPMPCEMSGIKGMWKLSKLK